MPSATWNAKITLCGKRVEFKLDTGAEVSALSERVYYELENKPFMIPARKNYLAQLAPHLKLWDNFRGT